ncbi:MAG: hypothetical protein ACREKM_11980 [Longimicrobiales bacterium]
MILRPDRERRGPDPSLPARLFIFGSGAVLAYAGMAWDRPMLVVLAIAELAAGVLLSLRARRNREERRDHNDHDGNERDGT